jgi:uncharacterized glyoxalase superfamily protein PhnB
MSGAKKTVSTIAPGLLYHNAAEAIEWLCRAFGFEKQLVVPGENGTVAHAQLVFGNGMLMLGSAETFTYPHLLKSPRDLGGVGTCEPCVVVEDADAHHARAVAAGGEIVHPLEDKPYGGRGYSCRDPEGHVWHFGTYDPWADCGEA